MTLAYTTYDRQRRLPEQSPGWSGLDRHRILDSAALRRLDGITQSAEPDAPHRPLTRFGHSLLVAGIARRIACPLGADPDLVEAAGLAHDLGHPPFGHNGERVLDEAGVGCGGFDANAQTLRILTRIEAHTVDGRHSPGLNLTRATLDATCKYPWPADAHPDRPGPPAAGRRKFGVYPDDVPVLTWLRGQRSDHALCLEAQIVDWADDIANAVHDAADGLRSGAIPATALTDADDAADIAALAADHHTTLPGGDVDAAARRLAPVLAATAPAASRHEPDPCAPAGAALKQWTDDTVASLIAAAVTATRTHHSGPLTRYRATLVVDPAATADVAVLKALTLRHVLRCPARQSRRAGQRELLAELVDRLTRRAPRHLDQPYRRWWDTAGDDTARQRIIIDQVAALTEQAAVDRHRDLGQAR